MPKTIVVTNLILLACLSALANSGLVTWLGGEVRFGRFGFLVLTCVGLACAGIMFLTEVFTGIRWVPVVALASLGYGWLATGPDGVAPRSSEIGWAVGWLSVAVWFAYLAAQSRENR